MPKRANSIITDLEDIAGPDNVLHDSAAMVPFLTEPRKRFHTAAAAVVLPRDVNTLQKLVGWANEKKLPLIPQGGNTGLVGAQVPLSGAEIIVSLRHLNKVRRIDAAAGYMEVEAGLILQKAHEAAKGAGMLFPLTIASQGSATIGGVLSTNAGGHAGSFLWQCAGALSGGGGGDGQRRALSRAKRPAQGQYGL